MAGVPPFLAAQVNDVLSALRATLADATPEVRAAAPRVMAASRFVAEACMRHPERARRWLVGPWLEQKLDAGSVQAQLSSAAETDAAHLGELRRVRQEEMLRIAFRDIAGWADLDETLEALTQLADLCCASAADAAYVAQQRRFGLPRDADGRSVRPVIMGLGKLGGRELNFSSDVDLICCYGGEGDTDGPRSVSNAEFFERFIQDFTRRLAQRTAEGFVYRVDWMLRPFGASGPPAISVAAMEEYYQVHGREWERYALIKARPVAGDVEAGQRLLQALRPFIYRRYLDFDAVGSLRELKRKIQADVVRRGQEHNLKLGPGGIREVEFIVQAFQLMRGGQEPRLRDTRLRPVLDYLAEAGHLPGETVRGLQRAYTLLRRTENALQMWTDEQTHGIPDSEEARMALCAALHFPSWSAFDQELKVARAFVQDEFDRIFSESAGGAQSVDPGLKLAWEGTPEAATQALQDAGFGERAGDLRRELSQLRQSRLLRGLSESGQARLTALVPVLLEAARSEKDPPTAALRVLQVISAIAGRSTYLTLLHESATARAQLVRLCAASPWTTDLLAQSPMLLDQLLDPRSLYAPPDRERMRLELDAMVGNCDAADTEGLMNALRRYRQETMLRIAAADLVQALPLVQVSDRLTWLAEVILNKTLELTQAEMRSLYGEPRRSDGAPAGFGVVAYGKFGGLEMGYGSDLDIVFLHDCDTLDQETIGGARGIANEVWLARLAQRIITWIATQTSAGRCYEVDLELRPDGRRGLTVTSLRTFEQYQKEQAWTWEHQALTRARPVAGSVSVLEKFDKVRRAVLVQPRDGDRLRREILEMRSRMREHLEKRLPGQFDVKHGRGGLTDIEFITQYLVLREAAQHPPLVAFPDNWRQTEALMAAHVLPVEAGQTLIGVYRQYRAWLHTADLQGADRLVPEEQARALAARVTSAWDALFTG